MRALLKRVAVFVLPWLLLAYPMDVLLTHWLRNTREYAGEVEVWNDIYDGRINADLLIYGSSRAWTHVDPAILQDSLGLSCYNLGMDGQTFWLEYFRHRQYLKHNRKPRLIVMCIDIYSLAARGELFNKNQFLPFMLWNRDVYDYTSPYTGFTRADYIVPLFRYGCNSKATVHALLSAFGLQSAVPYRARGYRPKDAPWGRDFIKARAKMKYFTADVDSTVRSTFDAFLRECRRDSIDVVLVYTPEYIEGQQFIRNRGKIIALYRQLSASHAVDFLDYSSDPMCSQRKYFFNATHLNREGAERFTRQLAADLALRGHIVGRSERPEEHVPNP